MTIPYMTSDLHPIDILAGEIAIEVRAVVGVSPALWYFRYIASIFLTTQAPVVEAKVGHVRHISTFRSFSGFIIALRNIPEKFRKKSSGNVIIYQYGHSRYPANNLVRT
jgi:hypothetical protein